MPHRHARETVQIRLVGVAVKHKAIDALAEFKIPFRLDGCRMETPFLLLIRGKCFRTHNRPPVQVRDGSHLVGFASRVRNTKLRRMIRV